MTNPIVLDDTTLTQFQQEGVVLIKGLFADHVETLRKGVERNMEEPGPFASNNEKEGHVGRFFDDYCNWDRITELEEVIFTSQAAQVAAQLMASERVQLFHDHVLVKEPGTSLPTPWHQDGPYYFVEGKQNVSFWCPLDPVDEATLRFVAGSHAWEKPVLPIRWVSEQGFFPDEGKYMPIPDPDAQGMPIREWSMEPGDAVAFNFHTLHGARANMSDNRRRAFSVRLLGDDARYISRPGPTSPPYPGHDMVDGQVLRKDWFPFLI